MRGPSRWPRRTLDRANCGQALQHQGAVEAYAVGMLNVTRTSRSRAFLCTAPAIMAWAALGTVVAACAPSPASGAPVTEPAPSGAFATEPVDTARSAPPSSAPTSSASSSPSASAFVAPRERGTPQSAPPPSTADGGPTLGAEIDLLREVQRALVAHPAAALALLDEHAARFPESLLRDERTALRIDALCRLGRTAEAGALLPRLSGSPVLASNARLRCAPLARAGPGGRRGPLKRLAARDYGPREGITAPGGAFGSSTKWIR